MLLNTPLKDLTVIAFDTETSGAYPIESELCEIAAVKWQAGKIVDTFQTLVRPTRPMSDFIIGIHGITNEMVADAPLPSEVIPKFRSFLKDSIVMAHHAAFDLGFLAYEFEKKGLMFPAAPAFCTSLMSRHLFPESTNHKLQTLVEFFDLPKGVAHRALDDTKACLEVGLRCFEKLGWETSLEEAFKSQGGPMEWKDFSLYELQNSEKGNVIVTAIQKASQIELSYRHQNDRRILRPVGVVRNPKGDYLVAFEGYDKQHKRFYFDKIVSARLI